MVIAEEELASGDRFALELSVAGGCEERSARNSSSGRGDREDDDDDKASVDDGTCPTKIKTAAATAHVIKGTGGFPPIHPPTHATPIQIGPLRSMVGWHP